MQPWHPPLRYLGSCSQACLEEHTEGMLLRVPQLMQLSLSLKRKGCWLMLQPEESS